MNKITIYTKDYCPFCTKAKSLLTLKKIQFVEINLNQNPDKFDEMLKKSDGARTVPQIFAVIIILAIVINLPLDSEIS